MGISYARPQQEQEPEDQQGPLPTPEQPNQSFLGSLGKFGLGMGETVAALTVGPSEEYKKDFERGAGELAKSLGFRSSMGAPISMVDTVGDFYLGSTEGLYNVIGAQDAAREVNESRRRGLAARDKWDAFNADMDKKAAVGEYWAGIVRGAHESIATSAAAGVTGAGLPTLSNYYAVQSTQDSLRRNPDNVPAAALHGVFEGSLTRILGAKLQPSTAKLAGAEKAEASKLLNRAIAKAKSRTGLDKPIDAMAGMAGEMAEEIAVEASHYFTDTATGIEDFNWDTLTTRLRDAAVAAGVTAGTIEGVSHGGRYLTPQGTLTETPATPFDIEPVEPAPAPTPPAEWVKRLDRRIQDHQDMLTTGRVPEQEVEGIEADIAKWQKARADAAFAAENQHSLGLPFLDDEGNPETPIELERTPVKFRPSEEGPAKALAAYIQSPLKFNGPLRGELPMDDMAKADIANLDEALRIASQRSPYEGTAYRGMTFPDEAAREEFLGYASEPGQVYGDPGFLSSATREASAENFAGKHVPGIMFEIESKSGANLKTNEDELLFPRGTEFEITNIDRSGDMPRVFMREVSKVDPIGDVVSTMKQREAAVDSALSEELDAAEEALFKQELEQRSVPDGPGRPAEQQAASDRLAMNEYADKQKAKPTEQRIAEYTARKAQADKQRAKQNKAKTNTVVEQNVVADASQKSPAKENAELSAVDAKVVEQKGAALDPRIQTELDAIAEMEAELLALKSEMTADVEAVTGSPAVQEVALEEGVHRLDEIAEMEAAIAERVTQLEQWATTGHDPAVKRTKDQQRIDMLTKRLERADARVKEVRNQAKQDKQVRQELVDDAVSYIKDAVPPSQWGKLLVKARNVKTEKSLSTFLDYADKVIADYDHKLARKGFDAAVRRVNKAGLNKSEMDLLAATTEPVDLSPARRRKELEAVSAFIKDNPDADIPPSMAKELEKLDKIAFADLTTAELQDLTASIDTIATHAENRDTFLSFGQDMKIEDLVAKIKDDVATNRPRQTEAFGQTRASLANALYRPEDMLTGLSENLRALVWENIGVEGFRNYMRMHDTTIQEAEKAFADAGLSTARAVDKTGLGGSAMNEWRDATRNIGGSNMTRAEALQLHLMYLDPQLRKHMIDSGVIQDRTSKRPVPMRVNINDGTMREVMDFIGPQGTKIADHMFGMANSKLRDAVNQAWEVVHGVPLSTKSDYWPSRRAEDWLEKADDPMDFFAQFQEATLEGSRILKERTGGKSPLLLRDAFDVYSQHVDTVSRVSAYLAPARDAIQVLGRGDVKDTIIGPSSANVYDGIMEAIRLQIMPNTDKSPVSKLARRATRNSGASILGGSFTVPFYNVLGPVVTAGRIPNGFKLMAEATRDITRMSATGELNALEETARRDSPYWTHRYSEFQSEVTSGMIGSTRSFQPPSMQRLAMKHIEVSDKFARLLQYRMMQLDAERNRGMSPDDPRFNENVAREWERAVYRSDSTSHGLEMNGATRFGREHGLAAGFVMFESGASKGRSLLLHARNMAAQGEHKLSVQAAASAAVGSLLLAAVRQFSKAARDKDDEEFGHQLAQSVIGEQLGPAGAGVQKFYRSLMGLNVWNGSNNPMTNMLEETGWATIFTAQALREYATGGLDDEGDPKYQETAMKALDKLRPIAGAATGLPLQGTESSYDAFRNLITGNTEGPMDSLRAALDDMKKPDQDIGPMRNEMWEALQTGNDAEFLDAMVKVYEANPKSLNPSMFRGIVNNRPEYRLYMETRRFLSRNPDYRLEPKTQAWYNETEAKHQDEIEALGSMLQRNLGTFRKITK